MLNVTFKETVRCSIFLLFDHTLVSFRDLDNGKEGRDQMTQHMEALNYE
jgi:hypothetical protein